MTNGDRRADEEAIRALVDRQVKGWAAGDPAAYASVFTADADYITFLGTHHTGRDTITASYVPLFRRLLKGTRLLIDITEVRFLTPDVALVHANASVSKGARRRHRRGHPREHQRRRSHRRPLAARRLAEHHPPAGR